MGLRLRGLVGLAAMCVAGAGQACGGGDFGVDPAGTGGAGAATPEGAAGAGGADGGVSGAGGGGGAEASGDAIPDASAGDQEAGGGDADAGDAGCPAGKKRCGAQCVSTSDPSFGCGQPKCDPCSIANGKATCVQDVCAAGLCDPGWADCNGNPVDGCETHVENDAKNCGKCGTACTGPQVCAAGKCDLGCPAGKQNCGGSCVDVLSDPANCGQCAKTCPGALNAVGACKAGTCDISCNAGFGNCNGQPADGCETPLNTLSSCGACGSGCAAPANANPACAGGKCAWSCKEGWGNCDNVESNGCETATNTVQNCGGCQKPCLTNSNACCAGACANTKSDVLNCGACGVKCGGGQICSFGLCCPTGWQNCSGTCKNTQSDLFACGPSCTACNLPNAAPKCASGQCQIVSCQPGFADCDGQPGDGCEVDTTKDNKNCGGCNNPCMPNDFCSSGICCALGETGCNGKCVNTNYDLDNCGGCGKKCPTGLPGVATMACTLGVCMIATCNGSLKNCDGDCANGCECDPSQAMCTNCAPPKGCPVP